MARLVCITSSELQYNATKKCNRFTAWCALRMVCIVINEYALQKTYYITAIDSLL